MIKLKKIAGIAPLQMRRGEAGTPILRPWSSFVAGVCVAFPAPISGLGIEGFPRLTDVLNVGCAGLLVFALFRSAPLHRAIYGTLLVWAMTLPWVFMEICALAGIPDPPVQRMLIRWILAGFSAYMITAVMERPVLRARFLYGLLSGIFFSSLTLFYDFLAFSPEDTPVEDLALIALYNGKDIHDFVYRAVGIFGHANGAAGCVLLGVPILLGAIQEKKIPRWGIIAAFALAGTVFYLTKSRGSFMVSVALLAYWLWSQKDVRLPLMVAAGILLIGTLTLGSLNIGWSGDVLADRFLDSYGISINAGDRWWTIVTSLDLVSRNPLGMGSAYVQPLDIATGTNATHNAYLELALMGGVALTVLVTIRLVRTAVLLFSPRRPVEAWLAAYLLGIFAFENYFLQLNLQVITLWLVISPLRSFAMQTVSPTRTLTLTHPAL